MRFYLIPIIGFGISLSQIIHIEYFCDGSEMYPTYYGSPFVFMQRSLGSSMTYFYSISGLLLNILVWSIILGTLHFLITRLIRKRRDINIFKVIYKALIVILLVFTFIITLTSYTMMGRGFEKDRNYWYWNIDQEAKKWGAECEGRWIVWAL